ncbi:MFS transporter [Acinetobacter puyangensis]|uniref:MFS transporter, putative metabolite:H+ symporter n=1 Tax=Acinetobacter puyangensis TaxID=1096779 RepID=A0A240ECR7_9GAMM|nr:MFS transporter [Acinetobacter puyangensis]SNX46053.1 MFS transporter, putative metabolite:H+ symporter [Acinetobacter puyangensis]
MDLISRVQRIPVGKFHYTLLWMIGLGWMFDAMDTGMISFIMTELAADWSLDAKQKASIVSLTFVGMAIGAVVAGGVADKIGRKTVFAVTLFIYSIATALCAFAPNLTWLLVFRFIVGLGLGGQLPVAVSLVSEYIPAQVRGRFIVLLESFWGLGWLVAALVSYFFIPKFGWHAAFLIGGLPALYVFVIWKKVPESIPYLINRGRLQEAHQIVCKMEKQAGLPVIQQIKALPVAKQHDVSFRQLWSTTLWKRSLMLWLIWFGVVYSYYGIFTWLPSLLVQEGYTIVKSFEYVLVMILAQLPGYLAAAWCVEKFGRKFTLAGFIAACAVCAYFFGNAGSIIMIIVWGCLLSFFNLGAWGVVYTYTPEQYPTNIRAFGSGWASAIGRIGGICAPIVVTGMMDLPNSFHNVFLMFTAVLMAVALVVLILGEETKGRTLESISQ